MPNCGVCAKAVAAKQIKLVCCDCNGEFHAVCLKMSKADVDCITVDGLVWRCADCGANRRKSMRFESEASEGKLSLDDLVKAVYEIRDSQKSYEKGFNAAFESLNKTVEENTSVIRQQNEKVDKYCDMIDKLINENMQLKQKLKNLEDRLDDLEQYGRSNSVEIQGVPQEPNENVLTVVKDVGRALNMNITDEMVDACHRLGRRSNGGHPPGIIVKFVRRFDKDEILKQRRVKRNLSTRHMGRNDDRPIYVNESLSPSRRRLLAAAKVVQKQKNFKFLWVRNGKIFLRREENAPVTVVTSQAELDKL